MAVQTSYGFATGKGIAGGIFDMFHYPVDSRYNEEENGKLRFGVGVVKGSIPGSNVILPTSDSKSADFDGVVVNGFSNQQDLEGKVRVMKNQNVSVMRKGRIWVVLAKDAEPAYGDAGCFATEGGVEIAGRFIGAANGGIAPVELYGVDVAAASTTTGGDEGGGTSIGG